MVNSMEGSKSEDDEVEYEVERILAQYNTDGKTLYLVKWVGYSDERCTWEPYESFLNPQTLTEWRQQLAQGDTLDEEDVAALQDRMDAYVKAQEDNSLHQEEMEERPILVSVGQRSPFSSRNGNVQAESEETLTSHGVRRRSEPLSQPDYALVKRRRPSETFPMTSTTKRPRPESASINKSSLGQGDTIVAQTPGRASTNTTARRTQYRAGDQFKNLRHQNNYVKLARQEPAPDMSRIERRAPDDWMRRGSQICPQTQGNVSPKDQDNDQWLFVPDERNGAKAADKGALLSTQDGSRGESPVCLLARHHDKDASSRTTPPVSELGTRAHDTSHDTSLSTRTIAARNGRTWRHGDVVVHLLFGDHAVGDVKILHLPPWLRVKMLALKQPFEQTLNVHFLERNVLSVEAFSALARNLDKSAPALSTIESYEDTVQATDSLAEHLEVNNVAAVWEYPAQGENLIGILYSCRAAGWRHLGQKGVTVFQPRLHLLFRNVSHGFWLGHAPPEESLAAQRLGTISNMASSRRKGVDAQGSIDALPPYVHNGATNPNSTPKSQNAQVSISHQNLVKPALSSSSPPPVISFSIDVKDLLHAKDGSKRKPALYIAFAASHPVQANAVKRWLGDHVSVRHVYTDAEKAGWAEWCEEIDTKSGSIFFHDERPLYCDLKYFSRCLASAAGIACYNMSFERRHPGAYRCAISRLFPRGTAIFITERSILRYPEEALHMMRWFEKSSTGKVESWRMCLMPNAVEWILKRIQGCDSKNEESYLGMIDVIHRLQMQLYNWNVRRRDGDPEQFVTQVPRYEQQGFILPLPNLPGYSSWADIEDSDLTEDMVKARDIILLEYFCAWAATKAGQYRKFLVLDDIRTNKTQNHSWHIKFWDPIQFKREIRY